MQDKPKDRLHLLIVSGAEKLFQGEVSSVTSQNSKGEFDVLDQHTNFISLIEKNVRFIPLGGGEQEINFDKAVMQVFKNQVRIFLGLGGNMS